MTATQTERGAPRRLPARSVRRGATRALLLLIAGVSTMACQEATPSEPATPSTPLARPASLLAEAPTQELYAAADRNVLLQAARRIIDADPVATLITTDPEGRARARTVDCGGPDAEWYFWVATRPGTRKVEQIAGQPHVTLHFEIDDEGSYVSVMARATIHSNQPRLFEQKNPIDPDLMPVLFPDYPTDYLLIEIRPVWLELLSPTIEASTETWRPQAVVFESPPASSSP